MVSTLLKNAKSKTQKTEFLLRVRSTMLFFDCALLCFRSQMCNKPYKYWLGIILCTSNLPNPLFYRCNCFSLRKTTHFFKKKTAARTLGTWRSLDFPIFLILRYVEAFSVPFPTIGVYFLSFSFIFFRSIIVYLKSGSRLTFLSFPSYSSKVSLYT